MSTSDWIRERSSLKDGLETRTVTLEVLEETYQEVLTVARENGWSENEAPLVILANGLAYLRGRQQIAELARNGADEHVLEELNKTVRQLMQESSRYAVLKFKAFRMSQDNEALEMHESALNAENLMLRNRIEEFREDEERLKTRIADLEEQLEVLRLQLQPSPEEPATRPSAPSVVTGAAWKVERRRSDEGEKGPHTWAENLLPTVPFRFQKYVDELLFDDERILLFVDRPPFKPTTGKIASLLQRNREHEGLLMITDRMLLFMEDAVPPTQGMIHWGYRATLTAIERVRDAAVTETENALLLRLIFGAGKKNRRVDVPFPRSHARTLREAVSLLKRFGQPRRLLPRRIYEDAPNWEPHDVREALRAIRGREPGEQPERDRKVIEASCADGAVTVEKCALSLEAGRKIAAGSSAHVEIADVLSMDLIRALTKCSLTIQYVAARTPREWEVWFNYPESPPFVRAVSRLRHLMGQPEVRGENAEHATRR